MARKTKKAKKLSKRRKFKTGSKAGSKTAAAKKIPVKPKTRKTKPPSKKTYEHHADHYNTSESYLVDSLGEDLREAWEKIRDFGGSLGEHRRYASGRAIMFSRKVCFFFVRPKKTYLETVIMLPRGEAADGFKVVPSTKTKWAHTFKLVHADQVEGALTDAIAEAYATTPA